MISIKDKRTVPYTHRSPFKDAPQSQCRDLQLLMCVCVSQVVSAPWWPAPSSWASPSSTEATCKFSRSALPITPRSAFCFHVSSACLFAWDMIACSTPRHVHDLTCWSVPCSSPLQKMLDYLKEKRDAGFFKSLSGLMQSCRSTINKSSVKHIHRGHREVHSGDVLLSLFLLVSWIWMHLKGRTRQKDWEWRQRKERVSFVQSVRPVWYWWMAGYSHTIRVFFRPLLSHKQKCFYVRAFHNIST